MVSVEGVLPDLHYLLNGSGDIAQLDHLIQTYEAFLERANAGTIHPETGEGSMITGPQMLEFLRRAETQLDALRTLQANAEGHLALLVQKAIDGGR